MKKCVECIHCRIPMVQTFTGILFRLKPFPRRDRATCAITSRVTGKEWDQIECAVERTTQGSCGPDAVNFEARMGASGMNAQLAFSYHNTTRMTGAALADAIRATQHQDAAILAIFRNCPHGTLSPSQVWQLCTDAGKHWPLTSIRRAMSNLTRANALTMIGQQSIGIYGRPENRWALS